MTILIFLLVLFVLILVHEWGHFIVAKKTGMRVDEFGIGFPPKLFGFKKGETEYTFNLFPIGGFVRILGENGGDDGVELSAGDRERTFAAPSAVGAGARIGGWCDYEYYLRVVLVCGRSYDGVPTEVTPEQAGTSAQLIVNSVIPDSPAEQAGLKPGAHITGISLNNQVGELTPQGFRSLTETVGSSSLVVAYRSGEVSTTTTLTPAFGVLESEPDRVAVGVGLTLVETVQTPFLPALSTAAIRTFDTLVAITVGLSTLLVDTVRGQRISRCGWPGWYCGLVGEAAQFGGNGTPYFHGGYLFELSGYQYVAVSGIGRRSLLFCSD